MSMFKKPWCSKLKITTPIDDTDKDILIALQKSRIKISTRDLSEQLGVPDRTVRYRLKKLKEKGLLKPTSMQTYERKLGLGEKLVLLQANPQKEDALVSILDGLDIFYYYASTYGRYDGFIVYTMYPLVAPQMIQQLIEEMKNRDLVRDYFIFDLVDYTRKGADVEPLLPESDWDWSKWSNEVDNIFQEGCELDLGLEEFPKVETFDIKDIKMIKYMVENPSATLKEVSEKLDLSLTLVHKRVKRLEEIGVLRGIKDTFHPYEETSTIYLFIKSRDHAKKILCALHKLPFAFTVAMENRTHYELMLHLPPSEVNQFLQRTSLFRKFTEEFFIQFVVKSCGKGYSHLLSAYNEKTKSWELPFGDIMSKIKELGS
ncbi:MAG: winged helix-turn-helix transcriptional regulator [Candidatus Thorarchaeota archaeon]